jgi:hypothetical protein
MKHSHPSYLGEGFMGYDVPAARNFSSRSSASACIVRATFISPTAVRSQIRFMNAGGPRFTCQGARLRRRDRCAARSCSSRVT